jgi:small-conductance mechanosensitive channel
VKSEVNLSILSILNDQGVSIPYPQRELLVKGERPIVGGT